MRAATGPEFDALLSRGAEKRCLRLSDVERLAEGLEDEEVEALYEDIDERGIAFRDDCGRERAGLSHANGDLSEATVDSLKLFFARATGAPGRRIAMKRQREPLSVRAWGLARQLAFIAVAAVTYGGVRAATEGSAQTAVENGTDILAVERRLGIAWEDAMQSPVLARDVLVTVANWVYIWGHWPVIAAVAIALYRWNRPSYSLLRNAVFISGAIGFLFFALLPVAPPRLLEVGLVDTVLERSTAYRALQPPELTNQYAAFPSLHFGWNLLVGIVLFQSYRRIAIRIFAVVMPAAMALAIIVTANHYVLDVVGGAAVVLAGLVAATEIARRASPTLMEDVAVTDEPRGRTRSSVRRRAPKRKRPAALARGGSTRHLARRG